MKLLFVGEKRSLKAERMGVTWSDGRLAAKQLFDALRLAGIDPAGCVFLNWFEPEQAARIQELAATHTVIGMGRKVQLALTAAQVPHVSIVHPAARGSIRRKENYAAHIKEKLTTNELLQRMDDQL